MRIKENIINPFADYGNIVCGDRFLGRINDLKIVESRSLSPRRTGNLAIIGIPRIGKSSLVWKALMECKDALNIKNSIPIWINVGIYEEIPDFFRALLNNCVIELKQLNLMNKILHKLVKLALDDKQSWTNQYNSILEFFRNVKEINYRIVFILDEFDHARNIFKDSFSGFQKLREFSYNPNYPISFITTSRRSIHDIENTLKGSSTFYETFRNHYLGMFVKSDLEQYFQEFSSIGLSLPSLAKKQLNYYCGGHPYLLDMLGYEIVENFRLVKEISIEKAVRNIEQSMFEHYDHLEVIMKEDGNYSKLLQILFGPVVDVKQTDINTLISYRLIKKSPHNDQDLQERKHPKAAYTGFSEHFYNYLNIVQREVDLWPLLSQTEKELRLLISTGLHKHYKENWVEKMKNTHKKLFNIFDEAQKKQQQEEKSKKKETKKILIIILQ